MNKEIEKLLNDQIVKEIYSSNMYLSMSAYFYSVELDGFAKFFRKQSKEELEHADKIFDYINEAGGEVELGQIDKPNHEKSLVKIFKKSLEHEKFVTASIHNIVKHAWKKEDFAAFNFLQWFVTEQVEEESLFSNLLEKAKMAEGDKAALFMMNKELYNICEA